MKLHRRPARALVSATLALIVLFNLVSPALASLAEPAPASTSTPPSAVAVGPGSVGSISDQSAVAPDASAGSSSGARAPGPTASSAQADVISGLQADLSTGAAVTRYPINTPPARQGIGPSLALVYNSRQGNGWVGVGWDLSLGTIERSTRYGAPTYTTTDTFVWSSPAGGGELVYLGDDVYQLKIDTLFYKFVWYGNYWEVWDKSGVKYVYGQNTPSCNQTPYACVNNGPGVLQWNLSRIVDPYGNYMTVSYVHDQGQTYPQQVAWTGNENTGLAPGYTVDFELESRDDKPLSYRSGTAVTTAKLLASIAVKAGAATIRTYRLGYSYNPTGSRSLLTSVQEVGADDATTLPPTTFTYNWGQRGWAQDPQWEFPDGYFVSSWGTDDGRRLIDVNGDGLDDVVRAHGSEPRVTWLNTGHGWVQDPQWEFPDGYLVSSSGAAEGRELADVNGDGLVDVLVAKAGEWPRKTYLNTGHGWVQDPRWELPDGYLVSGSGVDEGRRLVDINGDGMVHS